MTFVCQLVVHMDLLPPTSIFRCMPSSLDLKLRRMLGAFAYALDGAELSYNRLRDAAECYSLPTPGEQPTQEMWPPERRLSMIVDAWAFVDHVNRARKLLGRFDVDPTTPPPEIAVFMEATRPANQIRNRLQHLDEDIYSGVNVEQGHPILGQVGWVDARSEPGFTRYSISSGPTIEGGTMASMQFSQPSSMMVGGFRLMASDREVDLDAVYSALKKFARAFELTTRKSMSSGLAVFAEAQGVEIERLCASAPCDMVTAMRFEPNGEDSWTWSTEASAGTVEVPPHAFRNEG